MSYCRWSSIINSKLSWQEEMQLRCERLSLEEILKLAGEDAELSDWYIFWQTNYLEDDEQTKDNQLLAVWNRLSKGSPSFTYEEIKEMYDNDSWEPLGVVTQKGFMRSCVKGWLQQVEEEYPDD